MDVRGKLGYHINQSAGPLALVGDAAYAALLQAADTPAEWNQGATGYGKRFASTAAASGIHSALAFGLDSVPHEDPRYFRAGSGGLLRRTGHAFRGVILTRTDRGTETLSTGDWAAITAPPISRTSGTPAVSTRWAWDSPRVLSNSRSIWPATWHWSFGRTSRKRCCADERSQHLRSA